ncbi:hypothetical protein CXB51_003429 [Gossypium anomalum]|uniref:glucose-6-phosphate dehydrogenase (NADP(+)) n=1 Tax=Gossypium anomalum TaxID=47600 RepID=A0A8J6DAJ7_9ROSI|nr:hypothetical protein CXB51_003429 [Gossypium anomalum]
MGSSEWSHRSDSFWSNDNVAETGCLSIIVLGASGDLAKKKTFPALFHLYCQGFLPPSEVHILGYARTKISDDELRNRIRGYLLGERSSSPSEDVSDFLKLVKYVSGSYDSAEGFQLLDKEIAMHEISKSSQEVSSRRLFYLALPPSVYPSVCRMIRKYCMNKSDLGGWTRVVVEKPFGKDLDSAELLSSQIGELFDEPQIYRIDHYLGKELVQNLLVLRFANRFFLPLWNCDNIDNVQIVFREEFRTEGRGGYFDEYGIIRDIIQNHLLQVFCLVAMEKPVSLKPEHIRDEKVKSLTTQIPQHLLLLSSVYTMKDGKAGKALNSRKAEIRVQFKDVPGEKQGRNEFVIRLQPSEAMYMKLTVKQPGLEMSTVQSELDLSYKQRYQGVTIPEAYERLILDTIRGDQQHFVRRDELKLTPYQRGSRGPTEADELSAKASYGQTHGYIWALPPYRNLL